MGKLTDSAIKPSIKPAEKPIKRMFDGLAACTC
jgi:hypothetical protein